MICIWTKVWPIIKLLNNSDILNIDQYITDDVTNFCQSLCSLFSSMGKPFIDLIFFSVYLRDNLGTGAIIGIFANYMVTALMLKRQHHHLVNYRHKEHI